MSGQVIGGIEIQMLADLARLRQDMTEAKGIVGKAAKELGDMASMAGRALGALGGGLSAAAFSGWIKGAIDAADETAKLAQRAGIATDKVAGLTLAFQQSGAGGADAMQKSLVKLSSELVTGNKTLEAMGIKTKDAREAFAQIADKIASMGDGTTKTAAVVDIFGAKLGANLIPLLNSGSQGLAEMDKLASDLGLTLDQETTASAERFNDAMDTVQQGVQGTARGIMKELLPSLEAVSLEMAEASKNGGAFAGVGDTLAVVLETLTVLAADVAFVFKGIGREIGGIAAQAGALAQLDFKGVAAIRDAMVGDAEKSRADLDAFQRRILMAREMAALTKDAAALDEPWVQRANAKTRATNDFEAALLRQSEATKKLAAETKKLADAEKDALSRRGLWELRRQDEADAAAEAAAKAAQAAQNDFVSQRGLQRLRWQDEAEAAADAKAQAEIDAMKRANDAIFDDWRRTTDQMAQSLTDALMTGGKSVAEYLRGLFRTLVLRPLLMPTATAISGAIAGVMPGAAGAATGSGGLGSSLGLLGSIGSSLGGLGSIFSAGMSTGLVSGLGSAGAMASAGMYGSSAAMGLGAVAPYLAIAGALYSQFKHKPTNHQGAALNIDALGRSSRTAGDGINNNFNQGTGDALSALTGASVLGLNALDTAFGGAGGFSAVSKFASDNNDPSLGYLNLMRGSRVVSNVGRDGGTNVKLYDKDNETAFKAFAQDVVGATRQALDSVALPKWAKDTFNELTSDAGMEGFDAAVRGVVAMQQALAGIKTTVEPLGAAFKSMANLSSDALKQLTDFTGGVEQFNQAALGYVQEYYNRDEIAGIKAAEVSKALKGAGLSTGMLDDKGDFRSLLESIDPNSSQGRQQIATLLSTADGYAQLTDYMAEQGLTLDQVATQSPGNAPLLEASNAQLQAANTGNTLLSRIADIVQRMFDQQTGPGRMFAPREVYRP